MSEAALLKGRRVVVGVSGGIAVYKAVELCSRLRKAGAEVRVTMTRAAAEFVTPLTFEAIAGSPAVTDLFERTRAWEMDHISDARWADLVVIAPATANIIAKMAVGIADDPLTTLVLAYDGPLMVAPAMNAQMYQHPATVQNLNTLRERGVRIVEPGEGRLACGEVGPGRLAEPQDIFEAVVERLTVGRDLAGKKILITAGPTREFIDPARFLSNPSSGKMGFALAHQAVARGAEVLLICGPTQLAPPQGAVIIPIVSTDDLLVAVREHLAQVDAAIFAAAPADYRPAQPSKQKSAKSESLSMDLVATPDVAAWAGRNRRDGQVLIAFAAETHEAEARAAEKMERKNCDYIVVNDISRSDIGFASDENEVVILGRDGSRKMIGKSGKTQVANAILNLLVPKER